MAREEDQEVEIRRLAKHTRAIDQRPSFFNGRSSHHVLLGSSLQRSLLWSGNPLRGNVSWDGSASCATKALEDMIATLKELGRTPKVMTQAGAPRGAFPQNSIRVFT